MKTSRFFTLISLLTILAGCGQNPDSNQVESNPFNDPVIRKIYTAADQRDYSKLKPYADSDNAAYRYAYTRVMGSVTDTAALPDLYELMKDFRPNIRLYAAFAVGQYRDTTNLIPLQYFLKKESIPEIKAEMLEAIGKSANGRAMRFLLKYFPETDPEKAGRLWGIYYASNHGFLREEHLDKVAEALESTHAESRESALHILNRQKEFPLDNYLPLLEELARTESRADIRVVATMAFAKIPGTNPALIEIAKSDTDPRVRAAAIAGLENDRSIAYREAIISALNDGVCWVAMEAAKQVKNITNPAYLEELKNLAITSETPEVRAAVLAAFLRQDELRKEGWRMWKRSQSRHQNPVEHATLFKPLNEIAAALDTLNAHALDDGPVGTAASRALISGAKWFDTWKVNVYENARKAFERGLLSQSELYASALTDSTLKDTTQINVSSIKKAINRFSEDGEIETRNSLRRLLSTSQGHEFDAEPVATEHPIDWELVTRISENATATIYIKEVRLSLNLLINDAPGSVSNFVRLAGNGFYDGTCFHRVVPNFVSQGGGTRGDGYGSTNYTIRSEFSPLHYGTGVAGLASAGKDTEGCQFFYTHLPTPHLNGRYTIFGVLDGGYSNLTEIHTGTIIDSIRVNY